jgi:hypothetical protein
MKYNAMLDPEINSGRQIYRTSRKLKKLLDTRKQKNCDRRHEVSVSSRSALEPLLKQQSIRVMPHQY